MLLFPASPNFQLWSQHQTDSDRLVKHKWPGATRNKTPPPVLTPTPHRAALTCSYTHQDASTYYHTYSLSYTKKEGGVEVCSQTLNAFAQGDASHLSIQGLTILSPVQSAQWRFGVTISTLRKKCILNGGRNTTLRAICDTTPTGSSIFCMLSENRGCFSKSHSFRKH